MINTVLIIMDILIIVTLFLILDESRTTSLIKSEMLRSVSKIEDMIRKIVSRLK